MSRYQIKCKCVNVRKIKQYSRSIKTAADKIPLMDRSLDSIGSCSLDVDADSSDISDTSGSLNFPTPISVKDITREFTANIRERCTLRSPLQPQPQRTITANTAAYVNLDGTRTGGVRMVLSPPVNDDDDAVAVDESTAPLEHNIISNNSLVVDAVEKKPSYLNLACCVNGYSNLTTYDSKIRQDINKSREVSPIRPSTSSLQYCKRSNSLAAPVLHTMPIHTKQPITAASNTANKYTTLINEAHNNNNNNHSNGLLENGDHLYSNGAAGDKSHGTTTTSSFIQQRVERLYGPGALAQGFYSPKKHSSSLSPVPRQKKTQYQQHELDVPPQSTELSRKFKQLSPSKDYGEFRKKLQNNCTQTATARSQLETSAAATTGHNGDVDLPVFRHLSHEFRAQLPTVSPKRSVPRTSPAPEVPLPATNGIKLPATATTTTNVDVVDHEPIKTPQLNSEEYISSTKIEPIMKATPEVEDVAVAVPVAVAQPVAVEKDGNYFLKILKDEQVRLLALAAVAEKYIDALTNNPDITEDTFGLLRSASGKARLLVSQKMKQFEGLCHNNLNRSPEDAFPTTIDDLQGFWDMVYLQVTHVDSIFADIEQLKSNDWHRVIEPPKADTTPLKSTKTPKTGNLKTKSTSGSGSGNAGGATGNSSKPPASNSVAAMKREAQRKQLMEMKRQRREALAAAAAAAADNNKTACDGDGDATKADGVGNGAVVDVVGNGDPNAAEVQATTIGDTVNIAVKNSS
ncbi:uncharacterized protein LOC132788546 isoform X1 [Drosophila nasuta]|uniref:uncharacterized protein LOC132788546 isoform X1 n=2 Tax=Drosophila nasuta TaxID=42062 RepID=UPI00295E72C9|nr:uncharacterized protein LOC132788546 isoform X1 [Drosophila nasuta]